LANLSRSPIKDHLLRYLQWPLVHYVEINQTAFHSCFRRCVCPYP
jgi:hypothetical protein